MLFKGGCGKDLDIKEAYRCTGCGGFFHLECIFKHFELEEGHDYARNALKKIKDYAIEKLPMKHYTKINALAELGLDRKPDSRRIKL
jgi:hypothetical protein